MRWISHIKSLVFPLMLAACTSLAHLEAAPSDRHAVNAQRAADIFGSLTSNTAAIRIFLRDMPKGGDLHTHLSGTPYAEEFLDWADQRAFCIDTQALVIKAPPCDWPEAVAARDLIENHPDLYARLVDAMSVRALLTGKTTDENGHAQFFNAFDRFLEIVAVEPGKAMASSRRAAARDTVLYQEIMYNPSLINRQSFSRAPASWRGDFETAYSDLQKRLPSLITRARAEVDLAESAATALLQCDAQAEAPRCDVEVRYNCYGLRLLPHAQLFEQLGLCFALIEADPRFVGVSLVQPEDHPLALKHYDLHMQMIAFFADKVPPAKIALHAGELTLGLVPGEDLSDHVAKAVNIAGSDRIGHGVDIAFETNARQTLQKMAAAQIAVEINLSSNAVILGVMGQDHPLNLYRSAQVPIVLSTDDLGVLRSDMTEQYVLAHIQHGLDYQALKRASRNSLHYAFLPGESYWQTARYNQVVPVCRSRQSQACVEYLSQNPKARLELKLEQAFQTFETDISTWSPQL